MYTKERESKKKNTFWECEQRRKGRCKGRAITKQVGECHLVKSTGSHNHLPNNSTA